jgi:non-lysosomal glucosylceramidase
VARAIHDRYAPARRNPYNEIECSDHYARAASGYSVFLSQWVSPSWAAR